MHGVVNSRETGTGLWLKYGCGFGYITKNLSKKVFSFNTKITLLFSRTIVKKLKKYSRIFYIF